MKRLALAFLIGACLAPLLADAQVCVTGKRITNDFSRPCYGEVVHYDRYVWSDEERAQIAELERSNQERANRAHAADQRALAERKLQEAKEQRAWEYRVRKAEQIDRAREADAKRARDRQLRDARARANALAARSNTVVRSK